MAGQPVRMALPDQGSAQPGWQRAFSERGESARERCFTRHFAGALPAAQTARCLTGGQYLDQRNGGREVENGLRDKGPGKGRAFTCRTAREAAETRHEGFDPGQTQHPDQLLMTLAQRTRGIVEPGQKLMLNTKPARG